MTLVLAFLRRRWRVLLPLAALLGLGAAAWLLWPRSAPAEVREKVKAEQVQHVDQVQAVQKVATQKRRREVTRTLPSGVVEHEVETVDSGEQTTARTETSIDTKTTVDRVTVYRPAPRPKWRVSAIAAADVSRIRLAAPADALLVGVSVERRLVGPLSAGAMALFPVAQPLAPVVGVSLTLEF